ncbi:MAG TPA: hypothetical protein VGF94_15645 [Kofleriaceae bacterium]|jgi:hypothetical protein
MQLAVKAGFGISIALGAAALGGQLVAHRHATAALPPATFPLPDVGACTGVTHYELQPDPPHYVQVDLDQDGMPELVVDEGTALRIERIDHHEIARVPLAESRNPCLSEFTVEPNRLVVRHYQPTAAGTCEASNVTDYYRIRDGRLSHVWVEDTIITLRQ